MHGRLLTRAQWEAVKDIEESTSRFAYDLGQEERFSKQVIAPHFAGREYRVCWYPGHLPNGVYGPPEYRFLVFDVSTKLVVGWGYDLVYALKDARETVNLIGADVLAEMLDAQRLAIEAKAAQEATEVIARARGQKKPRKITKRAKAVFEASEGKCHYCGTVLTLDGRWHIEHKFPRALFGGSEQENLVAACAPCNHAKRDKTDLEFKALLASRAA
jgi:hypothetical protein